MSRVLRLVCLSFLLLSTVVGSGLAAPAKPMLLPVDATPLTFETRHGARTLRIEIADTDDERERGLMFRKDFPTTRGMLFVFDETRQVMMWMQNTPRPLDMIFVDGSGRISSVRESTVPFSTAIISSGTPVRFVIEVDAGVAGKLGLEKGDRVRHPVIDKIVGSH